MESAVQKFFGRRSFRVEEIAERNSVSRAQKEDPRPCHKPGFSALGRVSIGTFFADSL
jgi:hypothetical protein